MAFTTPDFVLDASPVVDGIVAPFYILDASPVVEGLLIPGYVLDASPVTDGLVFPPFYLSEDTLLDFSLTGTGGILFSGVADVIGDPFIATGGILFSGEAEVDSVDVSISYVFPLGGIKYSGLATVATNFTVHAPSGGMKYSGTATIDDTVLLNFTHTPSGGILYSGEAREPTLIFKPSGGILFSGEAAVSSLSLQTYTPSGGILYSGAASIVAGFTFLPSGGLLYSGTATVVVKNPVFVPSGGFLYSGEALTIFKPSTVVLTPENPYADLFSGWAMNYATGAASRYEGLPMNSICEFNGANYVANAAGIYKLEKTDDAGQPINATATILSNTDFGLRSNKRVPYVYLGYKSDYNMRLTVVTNKDTAFYKDILKPEPGDRGNRVVLGRGLRGLYWTFRICNINGAFFELDTVHVDAVKLGRMGV